LDRLGLFLKTLQTVYRTQLAEAELVMWRETLKDYSYQEFERAMNHLIKNPPRYDPGDGQIQVWRGMPKLPDVIDTMLDFQQQAAVEYRRREGARLAAEMRELEKQRKERPGDFFGLADVLKEFKEKRPDLAMATDRDGNETPLKAMPSAYIPSEAELAEKKRQALELEKKYK
jgi:hypothetical protein